MQSTDHDSHRPGHDPSADLGDAPSANAIQSPSSLPCVPTKHAQDPESASSAESSVEESLHHALSDLERILEGKRDPGAKPRVSHGEGLAEDHEASGRTQRSAQRRMFDERSEQYSIPLLDEVVIPASMTTSPRCENALPNDWLVKLR